MLVSTRQWYRTHVIQIAFHIVSMLWVTYDQRQANIACYQGSNTDFNVCIEDNVISGLDCIDYLGGKIMTLPGHMLRTKSNGGTIYKIKKIPTC